MTSCTTRQLCLRGPQANDAPVNGVRGLRPLRAPGTRAAPRRVARMTSFSAAEVPDMDKRSTMNLILLGGAASVTLGLAGPFLGFFVPKGSGGGGGAQAAKDQLGNDVRASEWVKTHLPGDRSLAEGLKGDPTYLIVTEDKTIERFGINAVCTHMGCVVPWENAENKFKCPCHGSQYNAQGEVIRGPAPLPLALAHADVSEDGIVQFSAWTETDPRTDAAPWWK